MASSTPTMANHNIPTTATSHPDDPIPLEPHAIPQLTLQPAPSSSQTEQQSPKSSVDSLPWSAHGSDDSEAPMTPSTEPDQAVDEVVDRLQDLPAAAICENAARVRYGRPHLRLPVSW